MVKPPYGDVRNYCMGTLMTDGSNKTENKTPGIARPNNLRMLLLSAVILVAGIVIGSAGTTLIIGKDSRKIRPPGEGPAKIMTSRLREHLGLSDQQFAKIEPIIKTHMDKLRKIQEQARPQIEVEVNQMKEEISKLLTDDQKQRWEKQMKYFERGFRMQRGHGRGRGTSDGRGGSRKPRSGQGGQRGLGPDGEGRRQHREPMPDAPRGLEPGPDGEMRHQGQRKNLNFQTPLPPPIHDQNAPQ